MVIFPLGASVKRPKTLLSPSLLLAFFPACYLNKSFRMSKIAIGKSLALRVGLHQASRGRRKLNLRAASESVEVTE